MPSGEGTSKAAEVANPNPFVIILEEASLSVANVL